MTNWSGHPGSELIRRREAIGFFGKMEFQCRGVGVGGLEGREERGAAV